MYGFNPQPCKRSVYIPKGRGRKRNKENMSVRCGSKRLRKEDVRVWRDGSVVTLVDCSSRGPEFNSQQPHGGLQPSVMGSDALFSCV